MSSQSDATNGHVHWFKGTVKRVVAADPLKGITFETAIVDDGTGLTWRCIPTYKLEEFVA